MRTLTDLTAEGIIAGTLGDIGPHPRLGFAVWARKEPKHVFRVFSTLAEEISSTPLTVFVDDVCTIAMTGRTVREQEKMTQVYREFFTKLGCEVCLSSDLYQDRSILSVILPTAQALSISEFIRCMPEEKRQSLSSLSMDEAGHALLELTLFEHARDYCDVLLIGQFSQAILATHRNISSNPLSAIVLPKLADPESISRYLNAIKRTNYC